MAGGARSPNATITGINVTPLVDITLVLLIIFMVTAKLMVTPKAMSLDLPRAASGSEVQEIFSVELLGDGRTQVNGNRLTGDGEVLGLARAAKARDPMLRVVINADGHVSYSRVMKVLDLVRQAGLAKIGFGVVPVASAPAGVGEQN